MKYGIYKLTLSHITTYHCFKMTDAAEAAAEGYELIGAARTAKEASKIVDEMYLA